MMACGANAQSLSVAFTKDTILAETGSTTLALLKVINNGKESKNIQLNSMAEYGCQIISKIKPFYTIASKDTLTIPLKYFLQQNIKGSTLLPLNVGIRLQGEGSDFVIANTKFYVQVKEVIYASAVDNPVFMNVKDEYIAVKIRLENLGNVSEIINLKFNLPQEIFTDSLIVPINVAAGTDTTVVQLIYKGKNFNPDANYPIIVSATNGERNLSSFAMTIATIASDRKFFNSKQNARLPNTVQVFKNGIFSNVPNYNIYGFGFLPMRYNRRLDYRINTFYFPTAINRQFFLREIYVDYESPDAYFKIGDQTENFEKNVYGRGFKGLYRFNQVDFQGSLLRSNFFGTTAEGKFFRQSVYNGVFRYSTKFNEQFNTSSGVIQQFDQTTNTNSTVLGTEILYKPNASNSLKLNGGLSVERHFLNDDGFTKGGGAGGFEYSGLLGSFKLFSQSFFSNKDYSGTLRGVSILNQQIIYNIDAARTVGIRYFKNYSAPNLYFQTSTVVARVSQNDIYEFQYTRKLAKSSFSLTPYYTKQALQDPFLAQGKMVFYSADFFRFGSDYQYRSNSGQTINFFTDIGLVSPTSINSNTFFTGQFRVNYGRKNSGVNFFYNLGPVYVFEQFFFITTGRYKKNISLSPYSTLFFDNQRYRLLLIGNYAKDNQFNTMRYGFTSDLSVKLPYNFKAYVRYDYYKISNFGRYEGRLGIEKQFDKLYTNFHTLEVIFFRDENGNQKLDSNEKGQPGIVAAIKDAHFVSDANGRFTYKKLADGTYNINIIESGGWYLSAKTNTEVTITKDRKLIIPLVKGSVLRGKIALEKDKFTMFNELNLSGIRITALDSSGNETYVLTNSDGAFSMFLPIGRYSVIINRVALGSIFEFFNYNQDVLIELDKTSEIVFKVREKKRAVNTKKFSADGKLISSENSVPVDIDTLLIQIKVEYTNSNIYEVAKKYKNNPQDLIVLNALGSSNLKKGQMIYVYRLYNKADVQEYTVNVGKESTMSIATKFNMTDEEFLKLNKTNSNTIYKGQTVKVFKKKAY